ncbi:TetR/AcrR family transcriptional regulator [Leifsonia psychrotolerans]|uniref:AcrR family transcriptional regulator n=2 Tax=Glaciibacter psychrotolerans TaxID=670054 RepID=A0A7Z0J5M5_9MICO|nr:AcrR family transcriptional regulator [Leifsonia psychrotolerans]
MAPPTPTRDRLLDSFEDLLIEHGERAATLDGVAASAGVSKGGLLYHFGSKAALIEGLLARLGVLVAADILDIRSAPAGAVDFLIRTSASTGTPLDRTFVAVTRLAQGSHPQASEMLAGFRRQWVEVIEEAVGDRDVAQLVALISDGLYYESTVSDGIVSSGYDVSEAGLDRLLNVIARVIPPRA